MTLYGVPNRQMNCFLQENLYKVNIIMNALLVVRFIFSNIVCKYSAFCYDMYILLSITHFKKKSKIHS